MIPQWPEWILCVTLHVHLNLVYVQCFNKYNHLQLLPFNIFQGALPDETSFNLINESSIEDLNTRLKSPVSHNYFRPNFVVAGAKPLDEDNWKFIKIGDTVFKNIKPCTRWFIWLPTYNFIITRFPLPVHFTMFKPRVPRYLMQRESWVKHYLTHSFLPETVLLFYTSATSRACTTMIVWQNKNTSFWKSRIFFGEDKRIDSNLKLLVIFQMYFNYNRSWNRN